MIYPGGCLCGSVRFEVARSFLAGVNCYCEMCRKAHGGAYSTHVAMRRDQLQLMQGELAVYESSSSGRREFCPRCGSHVLVHGQTADDSVAVPAGCFDGHPPVAVVSHIFVADCVEWHVINDDLPQYDRWPPGVVATHLS